jgi:cytochrome P450
MVAATQDLIDGPWAAAAAAAAAAGNSQASGSRGQQHAAGSNSSLSPSVRDVYADFNTLTLNITLAALFGLKDSSSYTSSSSTNAGSSSSNGSISKRLTDSQTAARVVSAVERAFTYFAARGATAMVVPEWVPTPDNVAFKEAVQQLDDLVYGIIDARQEENSKQRQGADASSSSRTDLLQALLDSTDEAGRPMEKTALRDELMTLLVAGQEVGVVRLCFRCCAMHAQGCAAKLHVQNSVEMSARQLVLLTRF